MIRSFSVAAVAALLLAQPSFAQQLGDQPSAAVGAPGFDKGAIGDMFNLTASTPYTNYYHRAGATIADHDQAVSACYSLASAMDEPMGPTGPLPDLATVPGGYSVGGAVGLLVVAGIQGAIAENAAERREPMSRLVNLENCMVSFGWNVRSVAPDEEARLRGLSVDELRAELAGRVGQTEPGGQLLRTFGNELALGGRYRLGMVETTDQPSLSLRLATIPDDDVRAARLGYRDARRVSGRWIRLMPGLGVIGVRLRGSADQANMSARFVRMNDDGSRPASDGEPNSILVSFRDFSGGAPFETVDYFEAPAGTWRLAEILHGDTVVSLCLAAPQFSTGAGEGVFAGTIDLSSSVLPDTTTQAVTEVRDIPLRAAQYTQGGQARCAGAYLYAVQIPATGA